MHPIQHTVAAALALALLATLSACASQPATTADSGPEKGMVCSRETPTGSLMAVTKCRSAEQVEADKKAAGELANGVRNTSTGSSTRAGGL